jgi:hypothetical protein
MIAGSHTADWNARGERHRRRTTGGPTAVGPSRRRSPRGTCSPHRCFGPRQAPSGTSCTCLRLRASPGAPPPVSLAIGPLVARAALSAPRSRVRDVRPVIDALSQRDNVAGGPWVVSYPRTPSCRSVRTSRCHAASERTCPSGQHLPPARSRAPTACLGRRGGRWRGTQAEGPRGSRAAAGTSRIATKELGAARSSDAASTCPGDAAVVRDPQPSATPSSADAAPRPAFSNRVKDPQPSATPSSADAAPRPAFSNQRNSNNRAPRHPCSSTS